MSPKFLSANLCVSAISALKRNRGATESRWVQLFRFDGRASVLWARYSACDGNVAPHPLNQLTTNNGEEGLGSCSLRIPASCRESRQELVDFYRVLASFSLTVSRRRTFLQPQTPIRVRLRLTVKQSQHKLTSLLRSRFSRESRALRPGEGPSPVV